MYKWISLSSSCQHSNHDAMRTDRLEWAKFIEGIGGSSLPTQKPK